MHMHKALPVLTRPRLRMAPTGATTLAIGPVCGECCVLPFALPAVVLASAGGLIAFLAQAFGWTLYLATAMVVGVWLWVARDVRRTGKGPARSTPLSMSLAAVAQDAAMLWPFVEPRVVGAIHGSFRWRIIAAVADTATGPPDRPPVKHRLR